MRSPLNLDSRIALFFGSMFSHKTGEFIHMLDAYERASRRVIAFKLLGDRDAQNIKQFDPVPIKTHDGQSYPGIAVKDSTGINAYLNNPSNKCEVVGIDEVQFFDDRVITTMRQLRSNDRIVITNGLLFDFLGEYFRLDKGKGTTTMADVLYSTDELFPCYAICSFPGCRKTATRTQRLMADGVTPAPHDDPLFLPGDNVRTINPAYDRKYQARCPAHHYVSMNGHELLVDEFRELKTSLDR